MSSSKTNTGHRVFDRTPGGGGTLRERFSVGQSVLGVRVADKKPSKTTAVLFTTRAFRVFYFFFF